MIAGGALSKGTISTKRVRALVLRCCVPCAHFSLGKKCANRRVNLGPNVSTSVDGLRVKKQCCFLPRQFTVRPCKKLSAK